MLKPKSYNSTNGLELCVQGCLSTPRQKHSRFNASMDEIDPQRSAHALGRLSADLHSCRGTDDEAWQNSQFN